MSLYIRKISNNMQIFMKHLNCNGFFYIASRHSSVSVVPSLYDGNDPAPKFFSRHMQNLLRRLTRLDYTKIFKKRGDGEREVLKTPIYKFLTSEELEAEYKKVYRKANKLLQMPPVLQVQKPIDEVLSNDPALIGHDTAKYVFTDITYGVPNESRIIVQRDPDGVLRSCDHDVRKRMNQIFFPMKGRKIREPLMFTDEERFNSLLDRDEYIFVLDRACVQYEPDEPSYQRITSITYQHIDMKSKYDLLRSTRHFGPMVFYLTWHQSIDRLMLELLQNNAIRDAVLLVAVRQKIHNNVVDKEVLKKLSEDILHTPIEPPKLDSLTEKDVKMDNRCIAFIEKYISNNSSMKSQHELAFQGFREYYQQMFELSFGLQKASGQA